MSCKMLAAIEPRLEPPEVEKQNIRTADEIEELVRAGKKMPKEMSLPEQWFYEALRLLYRHIRYGMDAEDARRERAELKRGYERAAYRVKFERWRDGLYNRIDAAAREYRERPCIETADKFYNAVYGDISRRKLKT